MQMNLVCSAKCCHQNLYTSEVSIVQVENSKVQLTGMAASNAICESIPMF